MECIKRTVLFVNATLNWGSTGRIVEQIATRAVDDNWNCYIAHGARYANETVFPSFQVGGKFGNYLHVAYSLFIGKHGMASSRDTKSLVKYIKHIKPDIIHLHNIHGYYLNFELLFGFLSKSNIPVIWSLHDCWSMTGHCTHFDHIGCEEWKTKCGHCPLLKADYKSLLFDKSSNNYDSKKKAFTSLSNIHIVTVSEWLANIAKQSFLSIYPIQTIYNGVDTSVFAYKSSDIIRELKTGKKAVLLGVATDWDRNKGLYDYIELSNVLPSSYQIVMIGVSKSIRKKLPSNIIALERTSNIQELVGYYSSADIVLNLSYLETFGLTTVEGMSCGTPSIVYNRTASPELVTRETGKVVEAGDINAVKDAVFEICSKGRAVYSKACRKRALDFFNKDKCFDKYINLYNTIISNHEG